MYRPVQMQILQILGNTLLIQVGRRRAGNPPQLTQAARDQRRVMRRQLAFAAGTPPPQALGAARLGQTAAKTNAVTTVRPKPITLTRPKYQWL